MIDDFAVARLKTMQDAIDLVSQYAGLVGDVELDIGLVKDPWYLGLCPKPDGQPTRYLLMQKSDAVSESELSPTSRRIAELQKMDADFVKNGMFLSAERLQPSSKGVRLKYSEGKRTIMDGPFTESKEIIGGYCILRLNSIKEAIEGTFRFARE